MHVQKVASYFNIFFFNFIVLYYGHENGLALQKDFRISYTSSLNFVALIFTMNVYLSEKICE